MKFSSTFNTSVQRCLYPVFQNQCPHFLLLHIFRRMAVHPSPSEFTSRTHPLIFLWIPKGLISPEYFLIFFSNLRIPPIFQPWKRCFKLMVLRLLENTFVSQRLESVHFYSYPQAKLSPKFLSLLLQAEGNYPFLPSKVFWKSIFSQQRGRGIWSWKYHQN